MERTTQEGMTSALSGFLREALEGFKLKSPQRIDSDGSIDPEDAQWEQVEVYEYFAPLEDSQEHERLLEDYIHADPNAKRRASGESTLPKLKTRCPSVTVIPTEYNVSSNGGWDRISAKFQLSLVTFDPGVRMIDGFLELPDTQGWVSALSFSDRVIMALRRAGTIGGNLRRGDIRALPWMQSGAAVDVRPLYRTLIEVTLMCDDFAISKDMDDMN